MAAADFVPRRRDHVPRPHRKWAWCQISCEFRAMMEQYSWSLQLQYFWDMRDQSQISFSRDMVPFLISCHKYCDLIGQLETYKFLIETYKFFWPWAWKKVHVETTMHSNSNCTSTMAIQHTMTACVCIIMAKIEVATNGTSPHDQYYRTHMRTCT